MYSVHALYTSTHPTHTHMHTHFNVPFLCTHIIYRKLYHLPYPLLIFSSSFRSSYCMAFIPLAVTLGSYFSRCFHKAYMYMNVHTCAHNAFLCKWTCSLYSFSKHCVHTQMYTYSTLTLLHKWNLVRRYSCTIHLHTYTHTPWQTLNLSNDATHTTHTHVLACKICSAQPVHCTCTCIQFH